jgi:DNA-binding response OmpR family regulator
VDTLGRILLIDADDSIREFEGMVLVDEGYEVALAPNTSCALPLLLSFRPQVIILDLLTPEKNGAALVRTLRQAAGCGVSIVAVSTAPHFSEMAAALDVEVCLDKPFDLAAFLLCIQENLKHAPPGTSTT